MRRSIVLLLLLLLCSLMGCGLKELPQETKEGTEEITTELTSVSADAKELQLGMSEMEEQLVILDKERSQWLNYYELEDGDG